MHYADFAEDEVCKPMCITHTLQESLTYPPPPPKQSAALLAAIKEYEASKWKVIGQKVGKPAKVGAQDLPRAFFGIDASRHANNMQRNILAVAELEVAAALVLAAAAFPRVGHESRSASLYLAATGLPAANSLHVLFQSLYVFHNHLRSDFFSAACESRPPSLTRGFESSDHHRTQAHGLTGHHFFTLLVFPASHKFDFSWPQSNAGGDEEDLRVIAKLAQAIRFAQTLCFWRVLSTLMLPAP